jgi:hypothetical protein
VIRKAYLAFSSGELKMEWNPNDITSNICNFSTCTVTLS